MMKKDEGVKLGRVLNYSHEKWVNHSVKERKLNEIGIVEFLNCMVCDIYTRVFSRLETRVVLPS